MGHAGSDRETEIVTDDEWARTLTACGFEAVHLFPPPGSEGDAVSAPMPTTPLSRALQAYRLHSTGLSC